MDGAFNQARSYRHRIPAFLAHESEAIRGRFSAFAGMASV